MILGVSSACALGQSIPRVPVHRLFAVANRLYLEDRATGRARLFPMWNTRLANALFDRRFTRDVVAALDDYRRYGVNTVDVSIQGGEMGPNRNQLYPAAYNLDGTLKTSSPIWSNLDWLLDETDRRGMALNVMIWYHRRHGEVPDDAAALAATRLTARWLRATGHRHYFYDVVNEFEHYAFVNPGTHIPRPLFTTLQGALSLIHAVHQEDPGVLAGVSPLSVLLCPVGTLAIPGSPWVEADLIYGHGPVVSPLNKAAYRLQVAPANPLSKPYVNNEFFYQLRYELRLQTDPRTRALTYGHWDRSTVDNYLSDIRLLLGYGGWPNVYSHHQQYLNPTASLPEARVGPAGTQPEAAPGGGEPSMHWLFRAVADLRKLGAVPAALDFNDGHGSGLEDTLDGRWGYRGGAIEQTDDDAGAAWARLAADDGDLEVAFDVAFLSPPGPSGRAGIQIGGATPKDPAWRLLAGGDRFTVDRVGSAQPVRTVLAAKQPVDRYVLRIRDGRLTVDVSGRTALTLTGVTGVPNQNLLLLTQHAAAAFDNLRLTPFRDTNFDDEKTGAWTAATAGVWSVAKDPKNAANRIWRAGVPAGPPALAGLDRVFADFRFEATVNLAAAGRAALRFRTASATHATSAGYTLVLEAGGQVRLERETTRAAGVPIRTVPARFDPKHVRVAVTAEGRRLVVHIDGRVVLDVVDGIDAPSEGCLQLVAYPGTTDFDDLRIAVGPDRLPRVDFIPSAGPSLSAGSVFSFTDPDGLNDLGTLRLEVAPDGRTFLDLTLLLHPIFGLFDLVLAPDGKGFDFRLRVSIPVHSAPWAIRLTAADRAGQTTTASYAVW